MLTPPAPIDASHDTTGFSCGHPSLDSWLKTKALRSEGRTARTYVVLEGTDIVGYYCLATGAIARAEAPSKLRRNAPDPLPVAIIGRLAVTIEWAGQGIGSAMLQDGLKRILGISRAVGCRAALVHAIDDNAHTFYLRYGFIPFPATPRTLFLPTETIAAALE